MFAICTGTIVDGRCLDEYLPFDRYSQPGGNLKLSIYVRCARMVHRIYTVADVIHGHPGDREESDT